VQQRGLAVGGFVQGDWKALRKKLVAKLGAKVKEALKITSGGPAMNKRGAEIREMVEKKLLGKKVISKTNPQLPESYTYVESGGRITSIRRNLKWIRQVPGLTIEKSKPPATDFGEIKLGILASFDPNNRARAELRKNMKCKPGEQAHHIIPLALKDHPVAKLATSNGWNFNGANNGVCLDTSVHSGPHPNYTERVRLRLAALGAKYGDDWGQMKAPFQKYVSDQRNQLRAKTDKLD
jgi:hypothetical protein